jgi:hypothetical protein
MVNDDGNRLIGEAEGKDDKAIAVDKLDQLERNLREDFNRQGEEGASFATGVLFGNAFRLKPLEDREEFFKQKCVIAAKRSNIVLVRTPDLFVAARYLKAQRDAEFAKRCRDAIISSAGAVAILPTPPEMNITDQA